MKTALALLFLGCLHPAFSQPKTGSIRGRVVDEATKQGIPRAAVTAMPGGGGVAFGFANRMAPPQAPQYYGAQTDHEGNFLIPNLPPGEYVLNAQKSGYLNSDQFPSRTPGARRSVAVAPGQESAGPAVALIKQAVISGRVLNADGDPMEAVSVQAFPVSNRQVGGGGATTDDRGEFRIPRLPPGAYKLLATRHSMGMMVRTMPDGPRTVDAPTYFPAAVDSNSAAEIRVGPGDERSGADIRLQKSPAVRVSGRVTGELPPDMSLNLSLLPDVSPQIRMGGRGMMMSGHSQNSIASRDGEFVFAAVRPGDYVVMVHAHKAGSQLTGQAKVRVGTEDVDGVSITLATGVQLSGKVTSEGDRKLPLEQMHVSLSPAEAGVHGGGGAQIRPDGTFLMENVLRQRHVVVPIAPPGFFLKAVAFGGQRLPGLEIDTSAGDGVIELIYSDKAAVVEGTVEDPPAEMPPSAMAWLFPVAADGKYELSVVTSMQMKQTPINPQSKRFRIEGVRPGTYRLFAGDMMLPQILLDPAAWERLKGKGVEVKAEEGVTVPANARLLLEKDVEASQ